MPIVSIVNQKGGVAKTTTTANLGACLAARGQKTLIIDMDPQANLTLGLGCGALDIRYFRSKDTSQFHAKFAVFRRMGGKATAIVGS